VSSTPLPVLRKTKSATIVNVSSVIAIAADHVKDGIRVNCVMPGAPDTPWVGRLLEGAQIQLQRRNRSRLTNPLGGWLAQRKSHSQSVIWRTHLPDQLPGLRSMSMAASPACDCLLHVRSTLLDENTVVGYLRSREIFSPDSNPVVEVMSRRTTQNSV
jgi:hypothetical protein